MKKEEFEILGYKETKKERLMEKVLWVVLITIVLAIIFCYIAGGVLLWKIIEFLF